jgi:hypothetical protein
MLVRPPVVVRQKGKLFLLNGDEDVMALKLGGATKVEAVVLDLDKGAAASAAKPMGGPAVKPAAGKQPWQYTGPEVRHAVAAAGEAWDNKRAALEAERRVVNAERKLLKAKVPLTDAEQQRLQKLTDRYWQIGAQASLGNQNQDKELWRPLLKAEKPAEFSWSQSAHKVKPGTQDTWKQGVQAFTDMVGDGVLPPGKAVRLQYKKGRANYTMFDEVNLDHDSEVRTVVHELGHWLEDKSLRIHQAAIDFLNRRTQGETREQMKALLPASGYDASEVTKKDKFNPDNLGQLRWSGASEKGLYVGKQYFGSSKTAAIDHGQYATEVVSMGLEHMWHDAAAFATGDPEYFDFIWNLIRP